MGDGVPFVEWTGELRLYARLSGRHGAVAKASLNRANEYAVVEIGRASCRERV